MLFRSSGTVTINGRDVYQQSAAKRAKMLRSEVGFVFQQYNLVPFLTVEENIAQTGLKTAGYDLMERSRQVKVMTPSFQRAVMRP